MKTLDLIQGTPEWLAVRAKYFTASEAPVMLGLSKYKTRADLLREKATGILEDIDAATQRRFDSGHASEAATRVWAETFIGDDLYPVTGTVEIEGVPLLASFDGLTLDEELAWENKLWNESFATEVRAGNVPDTHWPQLEQQLIVSGASKVLFTVSDGGEKIESILYESQPARRTMVMAGWKQFAADVAAYKPEPIAAEVIGRAPETLPALFVQVEGRVVAGDVKEYKAHVDAWVAALPSVFETDQDFKDGAKAVKACEETEASLKALAQQIRGQMADVDTVFRLLEESGAVIRDARLRIDAAVKANGKRIREQAVTNAGNEFREYVAALTKRISYQMPFIQADFGAAIKGLKTVKSMNDAIGSALANAKIEANAIADRIHANKEAASDCMHLFPDFVAVCQKEPGDFANLLAARKAEAERRENERLERERERIRAEEQAKAEREAQAKAQAEQDARDAETARQRALEQERMRQEREAEMARIEAAQKQAISEALAAQQTPAGIAPAVQPAVTNNTGSASPVSLSPQGDCAAPDPAPAASATAPDAASVIDIQAVVVEHQDEIAAFMASRDFRADAGRVRAILVEFVKFQATRKAM